MSAPEDNPADDLEMTLEEWNEFEEERQANEALERDDPDEDDDSDDDDEYFCDNEP